MLSLSRIQRYLRSLPTNSERVANNSPQNLNEEIQRHTLRRIQQINVDQPRIERRLEELDHEWDIERVLMTNAAVLSMSGGLLGMVASRKWFLLPTFVGAFLLQHSVQGWCPPLSIFRRMGYRTSREIENERIALKALRGDFEQQFSSSPLSAYEAALR